MTSFPDRRECAYWLALAFHTGEQVRQRNGLVLTADRRAQLSLLDLVRLRTEDLPPALQKYEDIHRQVLRLEGRTSAQAFIVDQLFERGINVVPITSTVYPRHAATRLSPERAPTLLFMAGDPSLSGNPGVAVSGARHAGVKGLAFGRAAGRALAERGILVVSGLAKGVDTEAIEGALEAGGFAVGIAAEGILQSDTIHRKEVREGRLLVVSEFSPNQRWSARSAMARNSTIAAFSKALIVADCVASGGTSNQVAVHRRHNLPVLIRRGEGEGAFVAVLAKQPGVSALPWNSGKVSLPLFLSEPSTQLAECRITREQELHIELRGPAALDLDTVLAVIRDRWMQTLILPPTAVSPSPEKSAPDAESVSQTDPPPISQVPSTDDVAEVDRLLGSLGEGCTMLELRTRSGLPEKRLRFLLSSLESRGEIERHKVGRGVQYMVRRNERSMEQPETQQTTLKLADPNGGD